MIVHPVTLNAPSRLAALCRTELLDAPAEPAFDHLLRLVTRSLNVPAAMISLVDQDRQFFVSSRGLPEPWASRRETPLSHSLCQFMVGVRGPLAFADLHQHPQLHGFPAIAELGIVAYAAAPLIWEGEFLGAVCVFDRRPRDWPVEATALLTDCAAAIAGLIDMRVHAQAAARQADSTERDRRATVETLESTLLTTRRESEEFNRAVLSSLMANIAVLDRDGAIIAVNAAWERFSEENGGLGAGSGGGINYLNVCRAATGGDVAGASEAAEGIQAVLDGRAPHFTMEYPCHSAAEERWVQLFATPLLRRQGGAVVSHIDITSRKQTEIERDRLFQRERAARMETEAALRARDEFLVGVSHEFKTPLTVIKGFAQVLSRRAGRELPAVGWLADGLSTVNSASGKMAALVSQLLDAGRLSSGRPLDLDRQMVDLVALTRAVARDYQVTAQRHGITVETDLPELCGYWDAGRVARVITHLLANATAYSPPDSAVTVRLRRQSGAPSAPDWAVLAVEDQGAGIDPEDLPRIFDRFYRGASARDRVDGVGLGLASARQVVEQHGGAISVTSEVGAGATVTIRLPLVVEPAS